jgi:hypothetical protein
MKPSVVLIAWIIVLQCLSVSASDPTIDFVRDVRPIFEQHCYECHSGDKQESGFRLDIRELAMKGGDNFGPDIIPNDAANSHLVRLITSDDADEVMPPGNQRLSPREIDLLVQWIAQGAIWPNGVDKAVLEDRMDHWSFKPLQLHEDLDSIDAFIDKKLEDNGLVRSSPASAIDWLRRASIDLTGLPPTIEEVAEFTRQVSMESNESSDEAYRNVVDRLLASPRYGERWAQHWLDVVRYADTHGFEVNTERPNAWPYRDYVIRSFNDNTPNDRFVQEQIAGDAMAQDAATGFLVTASVLLPGQIGKDAPSVRLARQDSLDEMVNNIGQTFLGLSIGCARCHDHKFDPVSAKDYYAMQAFVAGVEYEDREIRSPEAEARKQQTIPLRARAAEIEERLNLLTPFATPGTTSKSTQAKENTESFAPTLAQWIRFTIHDSNLHPSLGLIEPCIDEFEIWTDEPTPRNLALATHGTKVTASSSNVSDLHKLEHIHDGKYGNEQSWMSGTPGQGWVLFELPEASKISKVVWSRDRNGVFQDRLPIAFTLEAGPSTDALSILAERKPLRTTVGAGPVNLDRIVPTLTRRIRFTILNTNSLEPCLDELEVYTTDGINIALSEHGTKATLSGSTLVPNRHDPTFIHDGKYGNESSWMGNEPGKGSVELEFPEAKTITRIVWSRDRTGKFEDRLPIEYRIEVLQDDSWHLVADSSDRHPHIAGMSRGPSFTIVGLLPEEADEAKKLLAEKTQLLGQVKLAELGDKAFAGQFRTPDKIHLLNRGDPEQPKEEISPSVPAQFGTLRLPENSPEQERRIALAKWITNPDNPLTSRVMVNRIWQGHFGSGLVNTPSDFGRNGLKPSHPELLDWLANEFVKSGWNIKQLHKQIMLSKTYRQSSKSNAVGLEKDRESRLLWRYPSRRIEAESLRDSMLAVSGSLNPQMYGRGYDLFQQRGGLSGFKPIEKPTWENQRRMIYAHKIRRESEAVFGAFDCPDAGQSTALRRASTTPIQALNLFNSTFTLDVSQAFAARIQKEAGDQLESQMEHAFLHAFSRKPSPDELLHVAPFAREHGLVGLCRVLFNSNEFLFIP